MKNKIIIFTIVSVIAISIFTIPCFALSFEEGQEYIFKEDINPNVFAQSSQSLSISFTLADDPSVTYTSLNMYYRGYYVLNYSNETTQIDVWNSDSGWEHDAFRSIIFTEAFPDVYSPFSIFFEDNEYIYKWSVYGTIYSLISEHLFVNHMEDSFVQLAVTLLSVILTMVVFVFPFGVVYMVFKFILTAIDRSI